MCGRLAYDAVHDNTPTLPRDTPDGVFRFRAVSWLFDPELLQIRRGTFADRLSEAAIEIPHAHACARSQVVDLEFPIPVHLDELLDAENLSIAVHLPS